MFGRIAGRYDLMNQIMSLGLDRQWRRRAAKAAAVPDGGMALDIGTGTGDLAFELADASPRATIIGADFTSQMLELAPAKASLLDLDTRTAWTRSDALLLPFADCSFDAVTSAFVLRNLTDLGIAFGEMRRVLKPGGRVVALEISPSSAPIWRALFEIYFHRLVPLVGRIVAGDAAAYQYLPSSVAAFLSPDAVSSVMSGAGLTPLRPTPLMMGSIVIHIGVRPG
jgi:demethylmenaquinone methyltransferase/2-methoxy-6-polyprenyl-1,4-benzoquinol methylase